jgi:cation-transporting ATPase E
MLVQSDKDFSNENTTPIAFILLEDNIRKDAQNTIKWFKENSVDIRVISGDNPVTVSEVARRVGIDSYDNYISLQGMSKQEVIEIADKYTIFGRVTPEQKATLVKALKAKGKTVAMTGDGVNDILALKEADCSVAIAAGSDAARSVSHLVLLDSNFSSMPSVVAEGRRVVNNIQKSSSLFLMKTLFTIIISIMVLLLGKSYPFSPVQFMALEYFVIGLPSFFLALQPNHNIIKGKFISNLLRNALPAGLTLVLNAAVIYGLFYYNIV